MSVFVPEMVFGSDPSYATRIPSAALIAPVFALVLTAFLSVYQAGLVAGNRLGANRCGSPTHVQG